MNAAPCARCGRHVGGRRHARDLCTPCYSTCHRNGTRADYDRRTWTNDDLVAEVRFLSDDRSPESICEALGKSPSAIAKALQRAGRADLAAPYSRIYEVARYHATRTNDLTRRTA